MIKCLLVFQEVKGALVMIDDISMHLTSYVTLTVAFRMLPLDELMHVLPNHNFETSKKKDFEDHTIKQVSTNMELLLSWTLLILPCFYNTVPKTLKVIFVGISRVKFVAF